ncbi:MAG: HupE/UreJ family protein [Gammaproteobacteria bacterium]|nr:HupE/UreJ family protein [Gammaproteobacteria bacterium]MCP5136903.1 HupE/UreJ family protein [Gammaproteobacteria bacterium]
MVSKIRTTLQRIGIFALLFLISAPGSADVVKPALVEISVYSDGHFMVELRASIEALLTGINGQYRNTKDAPNADEYDALRGLDPDALARAFEPFKTRLLDGIALKFDNRPAAIAIPKVHIPERGYTKVPRISVITLTGTVPQDARSLTWYYPLNFGDNAVRVRQVNAATEEYHWSEHQWIREDLPSEPFSLTELFAKRPFWQVVGAYMSVGFEHIVPLGMDHILFILGIFLLSTRLRPLLWQVTMFTVAHTITLGLATAGYIELPARLVEPLIALSIAYIGLENVWARELHRSRLFLVFAFGLLHGLGFAGMLRDFGMPKDAFMTALISFNVGVEFGQLALIGAAYLSVGYWFSGHRWYRLVVIIPASLLIGLTGLKWTIERLQIF